MRKPDYEHRQSQLRKLLRRAESSALLVSSPANITYLTGFTGGDSLFILMRNSGTLVSDARYEQQIEEECPGTNVFIRRQAESTLNAAGEIIKQFRLSSILVESDSLTLGQFESLKSQLTGTELGMSQGLVEQLREIKDDWEIHQIRRAVRIAERAFCAVKEGLTAESTESEIARDLEFMIRKLGGRGLAFPAIVGVGPRSALPHGHPQQHQLKEYPFVLIDWGANEGLYLSDLTRVLVTSRLPAKFERIYNDVLKAHEVASQLLRPGAKMSDIDRAARTVLDDAGLGKRFTHGLGHGFGLEIHESVRLSKGNDRLLAPGMVVTIEPGVYFPDWGGIRIEDDYWITDDGCERLSTLPRDLPSMHHMLP